MFCPEGTLILNLTPKLYLGNDDSLYYLSLVAYSIDIFETEGLGGTISFSWEGFAIFS
jgi:hypothetical protein